MSMISELRIEKLDSVKLEGRFKSSTDFRARVQEVNRRAQCLGENMVRIEPRPFAP